jgi:hypothetical protein
MKKLSELLKRFENWFDKKFGWFLSPNSKQGKEHKNNYN